MRLSRIVTLATLFAAASACSSSKSSSCNPGDPGACGGGQVCEAIAGGAPACFPPVAVSGKVTDLADDTPVVGARVVALDANRAPVSAVAITDSTGSYTIKVATTRTSGGAPAASVTLRTDAQGYQSFPGGVRAALPIDLAAATLSSDRSQWVLESALTDVGLIHLLDTTGLASISGKVAKPPSRVGVLVVAEPQSGGRGLTAIADTDGSYTIFNVPAAASPGIDYSVEAYGKGLNYRPATATLTVGQTAPSVDLAVANTTTATIDGNLIFNSAGTPTSVALVVASTYDAVLDRGEAPPALVADVLSGNGYRITGVPDGQYIALAGFGIDGDVRDLSGTGNTAPVSVVVQAGALVGALDSFKLTGAIQLDSIDGVKVGNDGVPVAIASAAPELVWSKAPSYSNADQYRVLVLDAFGRSVWDITQPFSGSNQFRTTYAGQQALQGGMYYQLRIQALDGAGNVLSQTEDLKGVFYRP